MPAGTARQLPPYHYQPSTTERRSLERLQEAGAGGGPAAAGGRQAALSRRHLSIYLSAARVRVGLTRDASERGARAVAPHAMRADLW